MFTGDINISKCVQKSYKYFELLSYYLCFRNPTLREKTKYGDLLTIDLSYFTGQNDENVRYFRIFCLKPISDFEIMGNLFHFQFEKKIESNQSMKALDEELKETHVEILSRFYKLFEMIHQYAYDFKNYLDDLDDGRYIQNSIESVFLDMDGKQLLVSEPCNLKSKMMSDVN